jgi:hypothetical protein
VDHVLIVLHQKTDGMSEAGNRAILEVLVARPAALRIAILIPDHVRLLENMRARHRFGGLIGSAPKRGSNLHRGDLAVAGLARIGFANYLIFLGEPGVKDPAEIHVTGMAASANDYASFRPNVQRAALIGGCDAENTARKLPLSDDSRHAVLQKYLHP